jgi:drug/metabolite transporter (DMT)-like permease
VTAARTRSWPVALCLATLYVIGSSNFLAQRVAVTGFPPLRMVGMRFAVAGVLLFAALRARGAPSPTAREWGAAALSAFPFLVLGIGGEAIAVQRVPSGLVALVFGSVPLWTTLLDRVWGGRLTRAEVVSLSLGTLGVLLVSLRGTLRADPTAAVVVVAAAACHGLGFALTRRLSLPTGATGTAAQMVCGGALLFAASAAAGERLASPPPASVVALAYVILFGSLLVYSALGYLIRNPRPALATSHAYVNPAVALVLGATLGRERFAWADVAGLLCVLSAVALVVVGGAGAERVVRSDPAPGREPAVDRHRDAGDEARSVGA